MGSPLQRIAGWLLLLAAAWCSSLGGLGLVLCFEPDGHWALELGGDDCGQCCAGEGQNPRDDTSIDACPCEDIAVSSGDVIRVKSSAGETRFAAGESAPLRVACSAVRASLRPASRTDLPRSHASAALPFVRSVVLVV